VIRDKIMADGAWIDKPGRRVFNLYRPPNIDPGDPMQAGRWLDHIHYIYPDDTEHIIKWLAHRVQHPGEKINHALVLHGSQGIGKDTILAPVKDAIDKWNANTISPENFLEKFNWFVKSVILIINEGKDLGDQSRYTFYERSKHYTATPPDTITCNEKHKREYSVPNVTSVIITTNHREGGMYLPEDDRRHYVASSRRTRDEFSDTYWTDIYQWYDQGGASHVAAYLAAYDLSCFDAKAPPPKTDAFWAIAQANRAPESDELADALERLGWPNALTLDDIWDATDDEFANWIRERKNARRVGLRLSDVGYQRVRNPDAESGLWRYRGKRQAIYVRSDLTTHDYLDAAKRLLKPDPRRPELDTLFVTGALHQHREARYPWAPMGTGHLIRERLLTALPLAPCWGRGWGWDHHVP